MYLVLKYNFQNVLNASFEYILQMYLVFKYLLPIPVDAMNPYI